MKNSDFINVKLSAAGERLAGEGKSVRINTSRREFAFEVGKAVRIERSYEWNKLLKDDKFEGEPIFEIVESADATQQSEPDTHE